MSDVTRRDVLKSSAAGVAWLAALGIPESVWALQDGEELVTFSDYTPEFKIEAQAANPTVRCFDLRRLTSWATPNDEHYTFHQTQTVKLDASNFTLRIGGFVERPREFTLDQLKARAGQARRAGHARVLRQLDSATAHGRSLEQRRVERRRARLGPQGMRAQAGRARGGVSRRGHGNREEVAGRQP